MKKSIFIFQLDKYSKDINYLDKFLNIVNNFTHLDYDLIIEHSDWGGGIRVSPKNKNTRIRKTIIDMVKIYNL